MTDPDNDGELIPLDAADVRQDLDGALEALAESIDKVDLASLTWTALALAERAQQWARQTVSAADATDARVFLTAEGALFDVTGRAVSAEASRFPHLAEAFAKGAEPVTVEG